MSARRVVSAGSPSDRSSGGGFALGHARRLLDGAFTLDGRSGLDSSSVVFADCFKIHVPGGGFRSTLLVASGHSTGIVVCVGIGLG